MSEPVAAVLIDITDENREALTNLAFSMYLGEICPFCGFVFKTLEELKEKEVVYYPNPKGRVACQTCWDGREA